LVNRKGAVLLWTRRPYPIPRSSPTAAPTTYRRCDQAWWSNSGRKGRVPIPGKGVGYAVGPHEHTQDFKEEPDARAESCQLQSTGVVSTEVVMLERRVGPKLGSCWKGASTDRSGSSGRCSRATSHACRSAQHHAL
jgi:hypothetical protein